MNRREKIDALAMVLAALDETDLGGWRHPRYLTLAEHCVEQLDPTMTVVYAANVKSGRLRSVKLHDYTGGRKILSWLRDREPELREHGVVIEPEVEQ